MKLLTTAMSRNDLLHLEALLNRKGIATHLQGEHMTAVSKSNPGVGLFVLLEDQYADAVALTHNPDHVVEFALSKKELENLAHSAKKGSLGTMSRFAGYAIALIFVVFGVATVILSKYL